MKRAEELINAVRRGHDEDPLELAQTRGEGQVARTVREEFERLGRTIEPLETGASPKDPPTARR